MLSVIKSLLLKVIDDIDSGNSKIPEDKEMEIIKYIKSFTDTTQRISKYKACEYLNISRATFDNYVREGKLPQGKKVAGFKELSWTKRDLDDFILKYKNSHNTLGV